MYVCIWRLTDGLDGVHAVQVLDYRCYFAVDKMLTEACA